MGVADSVQLVDSDSVPRLPIQVGRWNEHWNASPIFRPGFGEKLRIDAELDTRPTS